MTRRGVSLVELLIGMVMTAILTGAMTKVLISNSRSDERGDANRDARNVSRAAINMLSSELRMAEPAGVIAQTDDSTLTVREPYAFGLVCAASGSGTTVAFLPSADLPSSLTVAGHAGWAWRDSTGAYRYEATTTESAGNSATCTAVNITPLTASGGRVVSLPAPSAGVAVGSVAFLYRQVTYSLRASTSLPGRRGLFRTAGANGTPEELAAPFASTSRFRWFILDNAVPQDTLPTSLVDLRGVQFGLNGESRVTIRGATNPSKAPFSTSIFFQNRPN